MAKKKGAPDAPGMRGHRSRTKAGPLRAKREDALIGEIEKKYGIDTGMRSDAQLGTALKRHKVPSLKALVEKLRK